MPRLPAAPDLNWDEGGAPRATAFDDIYFSRNGGLEETRVVFHEGCGLPEAWKARTSFSILELGFGTGLNALATWAAWDQARARGGVLHYVSIEAFPMAREDAARALAAYSQLHPYTERLLKQWPVRARGMQRIWLDDFALTFVCADAREAVAGLEGSFDAFFLDGFTPSRNADLWSSDLMAGLARLAAPGARLATYSVAGNVRRALAQAGFEWQKKPGFAGKRERLEARYTGATSKRETLYPFAKANGTRVAIVGGGIAGAATAAAFARRGLRPRVIEAGPTLGVGASGAPAALLMPRLDRDELAPARLYRAAYLEALKTYEAIGAFAAIGVEERPADPRDGALLMDIAGDPPLPEALLRPRGEGLWHPGAGVISPMAAIGALAHDAQLMRDQHVSTLARDDGRWLIQSDEDVIAEAEIVVLCAGQGIGAFAQTRWLPLEYSRGQIEWGTVTGAPLTHAVTSGGYVAPYADGVLFGATFDPIEAGVSVAADEPSRAQNLETLRRLDPDLAQRVVVKGSRAGVRVSANDRMPIVGLLPDARVWAERFASLKDGRTPTDMHEPAPAHDGLYVFGALGARGFTLAPILAERIAAEALGEPQALDRGVIEATHPARFLVRALKRGQNLHF